MSHTWLELDHDVLRSNLTGITRVLSPATQLMAVVKSNAYGHGLIPVAKTAWKSGVRMFGVADVTEGSALRTLFPKARIIILGAINVSDVVVALANNLEPVIISDLHAHSLSLEVGRGRRTRRLGSSVLPRLLCHAKIDTGMGRLGIPWQGATDTILRLRKLKGLNIDGICTHLAAPHVDPDFSRKQADHLDGVLTSCRESGVEFNLVHVSNSGGVTLGRRWHHDAVRVGILMYGYGAPTLPIEKALKTKPFLSWKTRVIQVKRVPAGFSVSYDRTYFTPHPTTLATIDVGYADGYLRSLSNQGIVLIGGKRRPIRGRITMNLSIVDVGRNSTVKAGDEVVLLGRQGRSSIWADELAALAGTISYEILTGIRTTDRR